MRNSIEETTQAKQNKFHNVFEGSSETRYYVEEGLPLLVMSRGKYKKFKQLWLEGKPSST